MNWLKRNNTVLLLSGGHFLNDFYCNFLPVLLPIIMPRLDLSLTLSGLLVMVMSITSNVLQPVFGYFMDKRNFCRLLIPAIPFGAIFICSVGYVDSKYLLFLVIALTGLSVSAFHPLGSTLVSRAADHRSMGLAMSLYVGGGNIGFACAPLVIVSFTQSYSLNILPLLIVPSLLISLAYYHSNLMTYSTVQIKIASKNEKSFSLRKLLSGTAILRLNISMALRAWTHTAVSTFLPLLLIGHGLSPMLAGGMLTIFLVGAAIGGLIGGALSDRYGHKRIVVTFLLLGVLPTWYFFTHAAPEPLPLAALFLCGAGLQGPQPSSLIWAQRLLPNNAGMASGMMMGLSFGLGSAGTALSAALADHIGLDAALLLTTVPVFLAALTAFYTPFPANAK